MNSVKVNVGDKVCYYNGYMLKIGVVTDKFSNDTHSDIYYLIDNHNKYVYHRDIMKYENDLDVYIKDECLKSRKYTKKKYNYLFLDYSTNEDLFLKSIKINPTDSLNISKEFLKFFPDSVNYYSNILVLYSDYHWSSQKWQRNCQSRFMTINFQISKSKFTVKPNEWVKTKDFGDYKEWKIDFGTNFDELNKEIGKDIKYLLGDIRYNYNNLYFKRMIESPQDNSQMALRELYVKHNIETYFNMKKDLCSNGDEVLA